MSSYDAPFADLAPLLDRLREVAVSLDPEGRVVFAAAGVEALTGQARDDLVGATDPWLDAVLDEDRAALREARRRVLAGDGAVAHEYRLRHPGRDVLRAVRERWWPVVGDDGAVRRVDGLIEDRTLALARELDDDRRQRHERLGAMAGGIAHAFNNLLTVISGYASALEGNDKLDELEQRAATQISVAADRATDATRRLVAYQQGMPGRVEPIHVLRFLKETRDLIHGMISRSIELKVLGQRDLPELRGDPSRLQEAVLHLVANAREAMPQGGTLTLAVFPDERDGVAHLVMEVRDTGRGMDPAVRERVFEPFFTTREPGEDALGLGCALALEAVRAHGGTIEVESAPGEGTTFALWLPTAGSPGAAADGDAPGAPAGTRGTVFLVDCREGPRAALTAALEASGLAVEAFEDAMALARRPADAGPRPDALVIGDPGGGDSGGMLLRGVTASFRGLPAVIVDVDPASPVGQAAATVEGAQLLGAPLDPDRVAAAVQAALADG